MPSRNRILTLSDVEKAIAGDETKLNLINNVFGIKPDIDFLKWLKVKSTHNDERLNDFENGSKLLLKSYNQKLAKEIFSSQKKLINEFRKMLPAINEILEINMKIEYDSMVIFDEIGIKKLFLVIREILEEHRSYFSDSKWNVLALRFGLCGNSSHTKKEVADILGVSFAYVSEAEKLSLKTLRKNKLSFKNYVKVYVSSINSYSTEEIKKKSFYKKTSDYIYVGNDEFKFEGNYWALYIK